MDEDTIEQRIAALKSDLDDLGGKIVQHIKTVHSSVANNSGINLKNDPRNCIRSLRFDIDDILQIANSRSDKLEQYAADIERCEKLVCILESVNATADNIGRLDDAISGTDLSHVCTLINETNDCLENLPKFHSEFGLGHTVSALKRESKLLRGRFISKLKRLLELFIRFDCGCITVVDILKRGGYSIDGEEGGCGRANDVVGRFRTPSEVEGTTTTANDDSDNANNITLQSCWNAMDAVGIADEAVALMCSHAWYYLLKPLWSIKRSNGTVGVCANPTGTGTGSAVTSIASVDHPSVTKAVDTHKQQRYTLTLQLLINSTDRGTKLNTSNMSNNDNQSNNSVSYTDIMNSTAHCEALGACHIPFPVVLENVTAVFHFLTLHMMCNDNKVS